MASYLKKVPSGTDGDVTPARKISSGSDISLIPSSGSPTQRFPGGGGITAEFAIVPLKMDESFGSDLSMEEAVGKLHDLMHENHDLKSKYM